MSFTIKMTCTKKVASQSERSAATILRNADGSVRNADGSITKKEDVTLNKDGSFSTPKTVENPSGIPDETAKNVDLNRDGTIVGVPGSINTDYRPKDGLKHEKDASGRVKDAQDGAQYIPTVSLSFTITEDAEQNRSFFAQIPTGTLTIEDVIPSQDFEEGKAYNVVISPA